jgi:hypothetical protein
MRSKPLMLSALIGLGGVLAGAIAHFSRHQQVAQASPAATAVISPFAAGTQTVQRAPPAPPAGYPAVARRQPEFDADPADVPTAAADFPSYDESSIELTDEHQIPAERSGAGDADARAAAVRELDLASTDAFALLEQTLRSDSAVRNRLLAVNSLRLYGKQAGNAERARAALRLALSDADENVRTHAQDAYQELAR